MSRGFFIFFCLFASFFFAVRHTAAGAQEHPSLDGSFAVVDLCFVSTLRAQPRHFIIWCCPPNISSILTDHDELFELPGYPGRAGRLINRSVTVRTIRDFKHPRTGCTTLLLLSATTELLIINLIPQHDPQSDSKLACHRYTCFSETFVN